MKRPDSVTITEYDWSISWDPNLGSQAKAAGMTNADNLLLGVDPTLARRVQQETLVHEILHAIWKLTALQVTTPDADEDSPGELIIRTLAPYLLSVIRQNPEVLRWLRSP